MTERLFLAGTEIEISGDLTTTLFPDGLYVHASPHDTDQYRARAEALGYGSDTLAMSRQHEIGHALLAHWMGLPYSPTLRGVAEGKHWPRWQKEEAAVLALAAYANAAGVDLMAIARRNSRQPSYE